MGTKEDIIKALQNWRIFPSIPEDYKTDYDVLIAGLESASRESPEFTDDIQTRLKAATGWQVLNIKDINADSDLFFSICRMLYKGEFVLHAVSINGLFLQFVPHFNSDLDIATAAFDQNPMAYQYIGQKIQHMFDTKFIIEIENNGLLLWYASDRLKSNQEVVLAAVMQDGLALEFASKLLRANPSIVLAAMQNDPSAFQFAAPDVHLKDKQIMLLAIKNGRKFFLGLDDEYKYDEDNLLVALSNHRNILQKLNLRRIPHKLVLVAVELDGFAIRFASSAFQSDPSNRLAAVRQNGKVIQGIPNELVDMRLMIAAAAQDLDYICYFPKWYRHGMFKKKVYDMMIVRQEYLGNIPAQDFAELSKVFNSFSWI